ncbi:hypothetical protein Pcinc_015476 [Petrolisthes cinctipes]|uniref:Fatty acid hydroxylase domain-containing protein n=1 Tax=Petrolisthes cinctipes TaxID=88211 RepID=A0AAE1FSZ4_PETCI|nr:hypothetical protein Pcinc_015476 [Petrolisthes cinctipes]
MNDTKTHNTSGTDDEKKKKKKEEEEEMKGESRETTMTSRSKKARNPPITTSRFDPLAVTWTDRYRETLDRYWKRLPNFLGSFIATVAVFIFGSTVRGEWLLILVHFLKAFRNTTDVTTNITTSINGTGSGGLLLGIDLSQYHLQGLEFYFIVSTTVSYVMFLGMGGFLHWYYYVRQRDNAHEWKCQPTKFLSPEMERHEIMMGSSVLLLGSLLSGILACYIMNDGWTTVYFNVSDYGWLWYSVSWPVVFVLQDYSIYWTHRIYHTPFLYKHFHKMHHKYKQPTAFSVTAIHPFEFVHMQAILVSPIFLFPIHWTVLVTTMMYIFYHGIIDHSGINFKALWWQPWQPDAIFHDNHHQYFHVNFGFNCTYWDKLHGTLRRKDRVYREDLYYGKGKDVSQCTRAELQNALTERESENVTAYRGTIREEQINEVKNKLL